MSLMKNTLCFFSCGLILFSCYNGKFEKGDPTEINEELKIAEYWIPLDYDSIYLSIKEKITFSGKDTLDYLPADRELLYHIRYSELLKERMEHGHLILEPHNSSCQIDKINDSSFRIEPRDLKMLEIRYLLTFDAPYYFQYNRDGKFQTLAPNDTLFLCVKTRYLGWNSNR